MIVLVPENTVHVFIFTRAVLMQVSEQRQIGYTLSGSLCSCVYLSKACSFPILGPVTVCCTCLPLGAQPCQGKQSSWVCEGLAVSWAIEVTLMCVEIKMMLCVSVCVVCDILATGGSGCVGLGCSMRLSTAVFSSLPFWSDDTHFLLCAFQTENSLAWTCSPGNSRMPINLAQL